MNQIFQPLKPASLAEISVTLKELLFDALPFQRGKSDGAALAYVEALQGVSLEALRAGIGKFLRGECESVSPKFVPTPPELSRIVRSAAMPTRIPSERRLPAPVSVSDGERARMRLKMPMFQYAFSHGKIDELAQANIAGMEAMILLASEWGVPIPDELADIPSDQAERDWQTARRRAWASIEGNPPKFMRGNPEYFLNLYGG